MNDQRRLELRAAITVGDDSPVRLSTRPIERLESMASSSRAGPREGDAPRQRSSAGERLADDDGRFDLDLSHAAPVGLSSMVTAWWPTSWWRSAPGDRAQRAVRV